MTLTGYVEKIEETINGGYKEYRITVYFSHPAFPSCPPDLHETELWHNKDLHTEEERERYKSTIDYVERYMIQKANYKKTLEEILSLHLGRILLDQIEEEVKIP